MTTTTTAEVMKCWGIDQWRQIGWLDGCVAGWGLLIIYESDTGWTRTEIDESVTKGHTGDGSVDRIMSNYHLRPPLTPSYGDWRTGG